MSFGAVIGCPKMYCLSYIAYFHNFDGVCMSCVCAHVFVCCVLYVYVHVHGHVLLRVCVYVCCVCVCVCAHILYVCRHAPEFRGSDSFDSYTCQWPDPGDNPCCRHKAGRRLQFPPQTLGQSVEAEEGVERQPPAILHNTLSSFHPTNT